MGTKYLVAATQVASKAPFVLLNISQHALYKTILIKLTAIRSRRVVNVTFKAAEKMLVLTLIIRLDESLIDQCDKF